jgi:TetR/AcrR family transcriptional regulator
LTRGIRPGTLLVDQQVMPVAAVPGSRIRDAARSRQAILDAAEGLFAEQGYGATTMADVAAGAGLSRGAPAYFFNSKDELYRAVLGRAFDESLKLIASFPLGEGDLQGTLEAGIGAYLDFLAVRPNFVRLVVRECLEGGRFLSGLPEHVAAITAAIGAFVGESKRGGLRGAIDPAHLVLSAISLCWFPLIAVPLVEDLGFAPGTPKFLGARKEQVASLISHGALSEATR